MTTIQDAAARASEKKEFMKQIADMITSGIKREVDQTLQPLQDKLMRQEQLNLDLTRQFNHIKSELEALKKVLNKQKALEISNIEQDNTNNVLYHTSQRCCTPSTKS